MVVVVVVVVIYGLWCEPTKSLDKGVTASKK
jgi:hypothetical protein